MAYLIICLSFALAGGIVGRIKGSSFVLWFLISGLIPLLGLIAALVYCSDRDEVRRRFAGSPPEPSEIRLYSLRDSCGARLGPRPSRTHRTF
jgi:hypothetical protein